MSTLAPAPLPSICLVEDDAILGESLRDRLELEGYAVDWVTSTSAAAAALHGRSFDMVVCDDRLPDATGGDLLERMNRESVSLPPVLFITGYGDIERAVTLLKLGAVDYVTKPFDVETLLGKIRTHCARSRAEIPSARPALGISAAMREIESTLAQIGPYATHVVITGESGAGKEAVARHLHALVAGAADRPFVAVNCGALAESLLESELFGHERGAFTGAVRERRGLFEQAAGGTLFLDEIGEMPPSMQVRLLRVVQERVMHRVGGEHPIPVDFRLVCATSRDLRALVEQGRFREDLYYRINVVHVHVPPLRERHEDILWLADRFLARHNEAHPDRTRSLGDDARRWLVHYRWPGNVRELKNCIERAWVLSPAPEIGAYDLAGGVEPGRADTAGDEPDLRAFLRGCERAHIVDVLERQRGSIGRTADALGISRKSLWERMRRLGIEARRPAPPPEC